MARKPPAPVIAHADIAWLIGVEKVVPEPERWRERLAPNPAHPLFPSARLDLEDVPPGRVRGKLHLYARISKNGTPGDWSCGLVYTPYESRFSYPLIRCNGPHPTPHVNRIEGTRFINTPHIHFLTERYQRAGNLKSGYAVPTDSYDTLDGALTTLKDMTNLVAADALFLE